MKLFILVNSFLPLTGSYPMEKWFQIISLGINFAVLIAGFKVIRQVSRLEFQVELMWDSFQRRFGTLHTVRHSNKKEVG
jgi:hypothetical protein